jgi:hypothetical protein
MIGTSACLAQRGPFLPNAQPEPVEDPLKPGVLMIEGKEVTLECFPDVLRPAALALETPGCRFSGYSISTETLEEIPPVQERSVLIADERIEPLCRYPIPANFVNPTGGYQISTAIVQGWMISATQTLGAQIEGSAGWDLAVKLTAKVGVSTSIASTAQLQFSRTETQITSLAWTVADCHLQGIRLYRTKVRAQGRIWTVGRVSFYFVSSDGSITCPSKTLLCKIRPIASGEAFNADAPGGLVVPWLSTTPCCQSEVAPCCGRLLSNQGVSNPIP